MAIAASVAQGGVNAGSEATSSTCRPAMCGTVGAGDQNVPMAKRNASLLSELEAGLRDDRSSTTALLQKCILLGGQVGSERLRDWARQELRGYDQRDRVPEYRRFTAP